MSALLAFEAAARHLNITRAAVELSLTQTAVTHQIKNLEALVGVKLIERTAQGIKLTPTAARFLESIRPSLIEISGAVDRISTSCNQKRLRVSCLELFAIKRLIPLLPDFRSKHPDIVLDLQTKQTFTPLSHPEFDVAIWHGEGNWPWVDAIAVEAEELFPVCSPKLFDRAPPITECSDLRHHTAIKYSSGVLRDEWPFWLDGARERDLKFNDEIRCDNLVTSLQAAIDGLGVMLGRSSVVAADLATGRLVQPLSLRVKSPSSYYLVTPRQTTEAYKVAAFTEWFLSAVRRTEPD
jgi:LysR family glycine cleavage system transcriptional activator